VSERLVDLWLGDVRSPVRWTYCVGGQELADVQTCLLAAMAFGCKDPLAAMARERDCDGFMT
jgi:hypothetical protein